jgi:flagellum-specific ATP synthase
VSAAVRPIASRERATLAAATPYVRAGRVSSLIGSVVEAEGLAAPVGAIVEVSDGARRIPAEVVGFRRDAAVLIPLATFEGVRIGARAVPEPGARGTPTPVHCLGRILDGLGRPLDGGPAIPSSTLSGPARPASALQRRRVREPLDLGVRALNALLTVGVGTRVGLFAGSGVGKSTLLGQIADGTRADAIVIALIGERGREVREFVERDLGAARERAAVVVATSDEAPALRRRAAWLASDLAVGLRDAGRQVLLLMDSLSRFAAAQREIGLAAGEPPATRGYPPSVWSELPRLLERAGTAEGSGSITGLYTVLVEADDPDDPIADACRSFLDGHIVLSRRLAERGQFPAIDLLASVSRVMADVVSDDANALASRARAVLARHAEVEDLVSLGAYRAGSDARIDEALALAPKLHAFMMQPRAERADLAASVAALRGALSR